MSEDISLPSGFQDLEPFVQQWANRTFQSRLDARLGSVMPDIKAFYDAGAPRIHDIFAALDEFEPGALPPPEHRLYRLLLALGHVAQAVERHGQPHPPNTSYPNRLRVLAGPNPD